MKDDQYRLTFRRGFDYEAKRGYYQIVVTDKKGVPKFEAHSHYSNDEPIFLCDIININVVELGKEFPGNKVSMGDMFRHIEDGQP